MALAERGVKAEHDARPVRNLSPPTTNSYSCEETNAEDTDRL